MSRGVSICKKLALGAFFDESDDNLVRKSIGNDLHIVDAEELFSYTQEALNNLNADIKIFPEKN